MILFPFDYYRDNKDDYIGIFRDDNGPFCGTSFMPEAIMKIDVENL